MADEQDPKPGTSRKAFSDAAGGAQQQNGVFVNGTMASGPYAMKGKIWLSKERLTRSVMGKLFCLDPGTILLKSSQGNDMVAPDSTGAFPIEKLNPQLEWLCEGEPARKYGMFNSYTTVKTAGIGVLDFGLFITHIGLLVSLLVIEKKTTVTDGLTPFTYVAVSACLLLELVLALLLYLTGVVDIDDGDGPETEVAMCDCCGLGVYKKTLRYWNNTVMFAACMLGAMSLVATISYVVILIQNSSDTSTTGG